MSLTLRGISYTYAPDSPLRQLALADVSMELSPGRIAVIAGATGSGKSTLVRIGAGLLSPDSGAAQLDGVPLGARTARGAVGIVFQNPEQQLFGDSVLDDVAFGPRNLGMPREDAEVAAREALSLVDLDPEEFGSRSPFALSGGQARRVAIAGVLAMRPRYLLLDEPSAGLDAPARDGLIELLLRLRPTTAIAVVTHDLDEFLPLADDVVVLKSGRVAFGGTIEDLLRTPETLAEAGLRPPVVLEAQMRAREAGATLARLSLDVDEAAAALVAAMPPRPIAEVDR